MSIPQLHQAIINNISPEECSFSYDIKESSPEGFTALELAYALGNEQWIQALSALTFSKVLFEGEFLSPFTLFKKFKLTYSPFLTFKSYPHLKSVLNKIEKKISLNHHEKWNRDFYKGELLTGRFPSMELRWVNKEVGYGLFSIESLKKGTFITEYVGGVKHHLKSYFSSNDYLWEYGNERRERTGYQINAKKKGNLGRFINHSDNRNCEPRATLINGLLRIFFIAIKEIPKDDQISINYGINYWRRRKKLSN